MEHSATYGRKMITTYLILSVLELKKILSTSTLSLTSTKDVMSAQFMTVKSPQNLVKLI